MNNTISKICIYISVLLYTGNLNAQRFQVQRNGRVLAHSLSFDPSEISDEMPFELKELLRDYKTQTRYANRLKGKRVEPLLKSRRHQESPFNGSCPYYMYEDSTFSEDRCVVGCVATCIEQILNYYQYPSELQDTLHGWETSNYSIPDVMPGTKIDWDNILDDYSQTYNEVQARAVADLSYYCGVAAHMNWGPISSGANLFSAFDPLYDAFGYKTIAFVQRWLYSSDTWNRMLRRELENGRPICYSGHNMAFNGHAFNIDGVDEEGYYHLNWGYDNKWNGWFDLDYLNPFESTSDTTHLGQMEGLFCNQTALFMHPEDFVIDISDTLSSVNAFHGVNIDTITFRRKPDVKNYTISDITLTNTTADTIYYTFEALTYSPADTSIFEQADYVGISSVKLLPYEKRVWPVYCQFSEMGERVLAISTDDETFEYTAPIEIAEGTTPKLSFSEIDCQQIAYPNNLSAKFKIDITNSASSGYAGNLITYCLFRQNDDVDQRHWKVLQLPGGETETDSVEFQHLIDGETYTLCVRCPWPIVKEYTFTADSKNAVDCIDPQTVYLNNDIKYDLSGKPFSTNLKGIFVRNGHKFMKQ